MFRLLPLANGLENRMINFIKNKIFWIFLLGLISLYGVSFLIDKPNVIESIGAEIQVLTMTEKIELDGIEEVLKDKTPTEKAIIKSAEISKLKIEKYIKDDFEIEIIGDIKEIEVNGSNGIEFFAKAWKDGKPVGFGKNGSIEIERFRIYNPRILTDDPNGDIIIKQENEKGEIIERKVREDLEVATKNSLAEIIKKVGQENTEIIKGKIGNTTSTFYPEAGDGRIIERVTNASDQTSWDLTHDSALSTYSANYTSASLDAGGVSVLKPYIRWEISRAFFPFDTSALGTDTISSAIFSIYGVSTVNSWNDGKDYISVVKTFQASTDVLALADYEDCGYDTGTETGGRAKYTPVKGSDTDIDISSATTGDFNNFTLNATGIGWIDGAGMTKLGVREGHDIEDSKPTYPTGGAAWYHNWIIVYYSEQDGAGTDLDPKLVVEHEIAVGGAIPQSIIWFD